MFATQTPLEITVLLPKRAWLRSLQPEKQTGQAYIKNESATAGVLKMVSLQVPQEVANASNCFICDFVIPKSSHVILLKRSL